MKRKTYFIIGIALIVIIIAAIAVTIAINSNKSVKDLYFQTEIKNFVDLMKEMQKNQNDTAAKYKPFKEKPSRTRYEISARLSEAADKGSTSSNSSKDSSSKNFVNFSQQAIDFLNNTKLIYNSRYDVSKGINMTTLSLLLAGQSIVDVNTISQDDNLGLQIPVIYSKYFVMDKSNISGALENLGLKSPIKSIISPSSLKDAASFSTEDTRNLFTDYISFLQENITVDYISMSKNVELQELQHPSISSENSRGAKKTGKYNIFNIKLTEEKFKSAALKTIDFLCSDSRFINMTVGNLTSVLNLIEKSGFPGIAPSLGSMSDGIKNYGDIEYLKAILTDFINNSDFPEGFSMTLVVDLKGNIIDRKIYLSSEAAGEPVRKYNIQAGSFYTKATIEQGSDVNSNNNALIEYEEVRNKSQGDKYIRVNCVNNVWPDFDLTINLSSESSKDDKRKALNTSYLVDINLTAEELGFNNANILLDIKREDRYDVEFSMPELDSENAINLSTSSKDEIDALMIDLQFSAAKFLLGNQSILDAFTSK